MSLDLSALDAVEVLARFRDHTLSPVDYARDLVARARQNSDLNALQFFDPDYVVRAAESSVTEDPDGALAGLPLVVKDNINTTMYPTTGGTPALFDHTPQGDADAVKAVIGQGGYVGAKAGLHELALGITSNNAATGAVRNPHDPELIPGGSSGGTAAAIAAGIFPAGLGTDTGGSCRIPASLCGVVGFRPTIGRYSGNGVIPVTPSRDTVGPFARSVRDIALLDRVLAAGPQALDARPAATITLGVPRAVFWEDLDPHVARVAEAQLERLAAAGVRLVEIDLAPLAPHFEPASFPVVFHELMRALPDYLRDHAPDVSMRDLVAGIASPDVATAFAAQAGEGAISDEAYRAAMEVHRPAMRALYMQQVEAHGLDGVIFPTTPLPARPIGEDETVALNGARVPTFHTYIRNTDLSPNIGTPAISLPCPVGSGLPVGIELDGLPGRDRDLLAIAATVEVAMAQ